MGEPAATKRARLRGAAEGGARPDSAVLTRVEAAPRYGLAYETSLAALRGWLAEPGSDVEKFLKKAMRARHDELDQATRKVVASWALGAAVARGRLAHLLDRELRPGAGLEAELLLGLFVARERARAGQEPGGGEPHVPADVARVAGAQLFREEERPTPGARLAAAWSLPRWLAERWVSELGSAKAFRLGQAMSLPARVTLRANTLKTTRLRLLEALAGVGVRALPTAESRWGVWLPDGRPPGGGVWQLPGFGEGLFEVQDEGSQLIVLATEAQPGEHAVDYCAGRGGKTWALASLVAPGGSVRAWDVEADLRRQLRGDRAKRAGAPDIVSAPDVRPAPGPDGFGSADVVLVDAPCSSCGALRRHPSQRWALSPADVEKLAALQGQILLEAAALVRPGGRLVYATCSLLRAENLGVAEAFEASDLARGFAPWAIPRQGGAHWRTLLPSMEGTDGFFMARWTRRSPEAAGVAAET